MVLVELECHWFQNRKAIRKDIVESEMRYACEGVGDEAADQKGDDDQEQASVTMVCQKYRFSTRRSIAIVIAIMDCSGSFSSDIVYLARSLAWHLSGRICNAAGVALLLQPRQRNWSGPLRSCPVGDIQASPLFGQDHPRFPDKQNPREYTGALAGILRSTGFTTGHFLSTSLSTSLRIAWLRKPRGRGRLSLSAPSRRSRASTTCRDRDQNGGEAARPPSTG